MKMQKKGIIPLVIVLLLFDWAALDDISTGNEPDYTLEWLTIILSLVIFSLFLRGYLVKVKK